MDGSGAGLVYIESGKYVRKRLQTQLSEPVFVKKKRKTKATSYVIGCGLGKNSKRLKKLIKQEKPMVVDADALSYWAKHPRIIKKKHCETMCGTMACLCLLGLVIPLYRG